MGPRLLVASTVLDAPDAHALGRFYAALLDWEIVDVDDGWMKIRTPGGGASLSFQSTDAYVAPEWPGPGGQRMQAHLDLGTDDLEAALEKAMGLGARLADVQPQDDVRVLIDPVGHPFCLFQRDPYPGG